MPASPSLPDEAEHPARRKLPEGVRSFRELREGGCYYVDKTQYMIRLVSEGRHYVLSRPRHFGKSLFLDTLQELFEGNEPLFEGLDIHDHWNWSVRYPVVRLDFGPGEFSAPGSLEADLMAQLAAIERRMGLRIESRAVPERFAMLLKALHERTGQRVIVLVDEYDKPILDAMKEPEVARANRKALRNLYAVLGSSDARIGFTFFTGVGKFSRSSLFSGHPDVEDITLDPRFSAICGFTDPELDTVFAPELPGLDRDAIRDWYHGYGWLGDENVYCPHDVLALFRNRKFSAWWLETGTPELLVRTLCRRRVSSAAMAAMPCTHDLLSVFDVDHIGTEALLFQGGYLTVAGREEPDGAAPYRLGYPNRAVRQRLNEHMLRYLVKNTTRRMANQVRLYRTLAANDLSHLGKLFRRFFSSIPREWYVHHDMAGYEGYCASVFYSYFAALGFDVTVEDNTSRGRVEMAVLFRDNVYLFEFKVVEVAGEAAASARSSGGFADKYRYLNHPIHLVAVAFSKERRRVVSFEVVPAASPEVER